MSTSLRNYQEIKLRSVFKRCRFICHINKSVSYAFLSLRFYNNWPPIQIKGENRAAAPLLTATHSLLLCVFRVNVLVYYVTSWILKLLLIGLSIGCVCLTSISIRAAVTPRKKKKNTVIRVANYTGLLGVHEQ